MKSISAKNALCSLYISLRASGEPAKRSQNAVAAAWSEQQAALEPKGFQARRALQAQPTQQVQPERQALREQAALRGTRAVRERERQGSSLPSSPSFLKTHFPKVKERFQNTTTLPSRPQQYARIVP